MSLNIKDLEWLEVQNKKNSLGQIFTPKDIASLMTIIALESQPQSILDPCFGKGIFLEELIQYKAPENSIDIFGTEIDPELFDIVREKLPEVQITNMDFFDVSGNYDCILMNPPYIRHELLINNNPDFLSKEKIIKKINFNFTISPNSNLYIYFFIKGLQILKKKGNIVAIIPNTWMVSKYGLSFKKFLIQYFKIKYIINFDKDIFPNADVESCIIVIEKKENCDSNYNKTLFVDLNKKAINEILIEQNFESFALMHGKSVNLDASLCNSNWLNYFNQGEDIYTHNSNFIPLKELCSIKRGISTNYNEFFIPKNSSLIEKNPDNFLPIICSPKELIGYSTTNLKSLKQILYTNDSSKLSSALANYIEVFKKEILSNKKPKTIYNKLIAENENWYNLKLSSPGDIIFSYIIRDKKAFILNEANLITRDNFYQLYLKNSKFKYILFAILNSMFTSYSLENIGRSHGKGLLKIQKYELEDCLILNPNVLNTKDYHLLKDLGEQLSKEKNYPSSIIIQEINKVIINYISPSMTIEEYSEMLYKKEQKRLNKKN